jgi:hypothetical protein
VVAALAAVVDVAVADGVRRFPCKR